MQASTFAVKAKSGFALQDRRILPSVSDLRKNGLALVSRDLHMRKRTNCFGLGLRVQGVSISSSKPRSVRVQASAEGDVEDVAPTKIQVKSSGSVLPYVGVACLGAILLGYHLGVVNGALEYLAKDLGIEENTVLQGWVVSTLLAGATVGSFTGGSLADKFGRTKTFLLDAIPLAVGAFLCATAQSMETMTLWNWDWHILSYCAALHIRGPIFLTYYVFFHSRLNNLVITSSDTLYDQISPTEIRGTLGSVNQLFVCIGILAAFVAGLPLAGNPLWCFLLANYVLGMNSVPNT